MDLLGVYYQRLQNILVRYHYRYHLHLIHLQFHYFAKFHPFLLLLMLKI
jgi:hypothetical protein